MPEKKPTRAERRERQKQQRTEHEHNWLAPMGSPQELEMMRQWITYGSLSDQEREDIRKIMDNPLDSTRRNGLFWQTAKRSMMGSVSYETAMKRQRSLDNKEWLVACLTTQGREPKEIASLTNMSERTVDIAIRGLKDKLIKELDCAVGGINRSQLTRWFLGL